MEGKSGSATDSEPLTWLKNVYEHRKSTHNEALFSYFRGQTKQDDLTLPVVNLVTESCKTVFGNSSSNQAPQADLDPSACAAYLYYMVAEGLLQGLFPRDAQEQPAAAPKRFKGMLKVVNPPACTALVNCQEFHLPLIECALHLVIFITAPQQQGDGLQLQVSALLQREDRAALLWQAARSCLECFSPSSPCPLPTQLQAYLHTLQDHLLSGPVWASGSIMYELLAAGGGCHFQAGDMSLPHAITSAYAAQAIRCTQEVAWALQQQQQQQQQQAPDSSSCLAPDFHAACAWLMDQLLLHHLEVCFGVHMAVVAACCVYVAAKVLQAPLSFSSLTQVIIPCCGCPPDVFAAIELSTQPQQYGDLRTFYNNRFLPAVQHSVRSYLQAYKDWAAQHPSPTAAAATAPSGSLLDASQPQATPSHRRPFSTIQPTTTSAAAAASKGVPKPGHALPAYGLPVQDKENASVWEQQGVGGAGKGWQGLQAMTGFATQQQQQQKQGKFVPRGVTAGAHAMSSALPAAVSPMHMR